MGGRKRNKRNKVRRAKALADPKSDLNIPADFGSSFPPRLTLSSKKSKGNRLQKSMLLQMPHEIFRAIIFRIPIGSKSLQRVSLTGKSILSPLYSLENVAFAKSHILYQAKQFRYIGKFLRNENVAKNWCHLPLNYKTAAYEILFETKVFNRMPLDDTFHMWADWPLSADMAVVVIKRLCAGDGKTPPQIKPNHNCNRIIEWALRFGQSRVVEYLLSFNEVVENLNSAHEYMEKFERGKIKKALIETLFSNPIFDPSADENFLFLWAISNEYINLVRKFLADPRIDPTVYQNRALGTALKKQSLEIVEALLTHPAVDPSAICSYGFFFGYFAMPALELACSSRNVAIVKLLFAHPRINVTTDDWVFAVDSGMTAIIEIFLEKLDPVANDFFLLMEVAKTENIFFCKAVIRDSRVQEKMDQLAALLDRKLWRLLNDLCKPVWSKMTPVNEESYLQVRSILLAADNICPEFSDNMIYYVRIHYFESFSIVARTGFEWDIGLDGHNGVKVAVEEGLYDLLKLLISDNRVNVGANDNFALREANEKGNRRMVKLLLTKVDGTCIGRKNESK
ncbi:hypothetical protein HK100_010600 [Physocladia obscura]|uniref:Uncharacterized protein n=1 Tax=Physocladia obscura TaxID=109957 RepID=A0AAD5XHH0_9FUNG|nr:hypothetical protein HK100_010600 [Physocladia obscura]